MTDVDAWRRSPAMTWNKDAKDKAGAQLWGVGQNHRINNVRDCVPSYTINM